MLEELKEEPSTLKSSRAHLQPPAMLEHKVPPFFATYARLGHSLSLLGTTYQARTHPRGPPRSGSENLTVKG